MNNQNNLDKAVITIGTGKPLYIQMAVNLARSFKWWHKNSSIQFYLATDRKDLIPEDLQDINIIELNSEQANQGFCSKLYLDQLAPANKNLFIDADCLCYGNLDFVFERFKNCSVSAIGKLMKEGEFFGDIKNICHKFNVPEIPVFVGSVYYLEKGQLCSQIFKTAREIKLKYDEYGLVRLRGKPNEEPLISISMALHNQKNIEDNGQIKADLMCFESIIKADILTGITKLNVIKDKQKEPSFITANPVIIHYNDTYIQDHNYLIASSILKKIMLYKWNRWQALAYTNLLAFFVRQYREIIRFIKDNLRFIYRMLFGYRQIKKNVRF